MKAMLLAAGEGRRMLPLTETTPKPLLPVLDDSLIGHQLQRLQVAGIVDVVINVAYLGQQIVASLGDGGNYGVSIHYSSEAEPLETGGGINHALPQLGQAPFVLVNGDVWCDYPLQRLCCHALGDAVGHLILVPNPEHNTAGDFVLQPDGRLAQVTACSAAGEGYTYSGIALLRPQLVAEYPNRRDKFGLKEAFDWALARGRLTGELYSGYWLDVGTPQRLQQLRQRLQQQRGLGQSS